MVRDALGGHHFFRALYSIPGSVFSFLLCALLCALRSARLCSALCDLLRALHYASTRPLRQSDHDFGSAILAAILTRQLLGSFASVLVHSGCYWPSRRFTSGIKRHPSHLAPSAIILPETDSKTLVVFVISFNTLLGLYTIPIQPLA
jgi:hypothetical protein